MRRLVPALVAAAGLAACGGDPSALEPVTPEAESVADLTWLLVSVGAAVWVLVIVLLAAAMRRSGRDRGPRPRWIGTPLVVAGGVVLPSVVLLPILVVVLLTAADVTNDAQNGDLVIEVDGHQFWWEVRYPQSGAVTANEIHVPVGRPVTMVFRSDDVIHSFWVPNVAGKVDLIPGETTSLRFTVTRGGVYRGACAEFCGIQHARMELLLVAEEPQDFEAWADAMAADAAPPSGRSAVAGRDAFSDIGCGACHAIRGTQASGGIGPDLTHLARRRTLAAGAIPNTRGHLAGWIVNAQEIKPGSLMPPQVIEPDQLQALLDYLEGLE